MNFEESNSFMQEEEKKDKKKKQVIVAIVMCTALILLMLALIGLIQYQDYKTFKMFIDGKQYYPSSILYKEVDGKTYVNVKEMGDLLNYKYKQGEYNQYNENETSCYITSDFEIITFTVEETNFIKYAKALTTDKMIANIPTTVKSDAGQAQKYNLESEIKLIDGAIYVPFEAATDIFNVQVDLSTENRIFIYTLDRIAQSIKNSVAKLNYTAISGDYENLKAMLYGFVVVGNGEEYGVVSLADGKEILSVQYEDITFMPNSHDFFIEAGNTVGIFSEEGDPVIEPLEYDEISIYDDETQLYLVRKDNKYGIINRLGKPIVYADYDEIGYKFKKSNNETIEYKLIFDKCIPVKEDNKYGLYSIDGTELSACVYDGFGSVITEDSATNEQPILEIPPELGIKGIIINQNGMYGLYDVTMERIIIPCSCTKAYSITRTAHTTYYVEHAGEQIDLNEYLETYNLKNIDENGLTTNQNTTSESDTPAE